MSFMYGIMWRGDEMTGLGARVDELTVSDPRAGLLFFIILLTLLPFFLIDAASTVIL